MGEIIYYVDKVGEIRIGKTITPKGEDNTILSFECQKDTKLQGRCVKRGLQVE